MRPRSIFKTKKPEEILYFHNTRCFKKTHLKEMTDFLTLKMSPVALALIKPKKRHLLAPLVKNHPFYIGNCSNSKFSLKIGGF